MKIPLHVSTLLLTVSAADKDSGERLKRQFGDFPSFFSSAKASFADHTSRTNSYPAPTTPTHPAPTSSYQAPAPAPTYPAPAPKYQPKEQSHACSIKEETSYAELCLPSLGQPKCSPVTLKGVQVQEKDKCVSISRTVCTVGEELANAEVCTIKYGKQPATAEATLVEVSFNKECSKQMVTVCKPGYQSNGYGHSKGYQKCEEIAQETCYNKPATAPKTEQVSVSLPKPEMSCSTQTFTLPTVDCEDITEERCVKLPELAPADVQAEQCTVELGGQSCQQIPLTLPVQVCREQVYGEAHKPHPAPAYPTRSSGYSG